MRAAFPGARLLFQTSGKGSSVFVTNVHLTSTPPQTHGEQSGRKRICLNLGARFFQALTTQMASSRRFK
jgi:hypothetical protein